MRQRQPRIEIPALRNLARGRDCTVNVPGVCNGNPETVVWAHSNHGKHGKAVGGKSHDHYGCFACSDCHDWLDNRAGFVDPEDRAAAFESAYIKTWNWLWENHFLTINRRG